MSSERLLSSESFETNVDMGEGANEKEDKEEEGEEEDCLGKIMEMKWIPWRAFPPLGLLMCALYCYTFTSLYIGKWQGYSTFSGVVQMCVFWLLGLLYIISYGRGALSCPGRVPGEWKEGPTGEYEIVDDDEFLLSLKENRTYWCKRCLHYKPPRTHHCSRCNQCVLKMDHHCIWFVVVVSVF